MKRKICVVTGTRAEFGLMFWILKELQNDKDIELQIVVTGMHLSPEFGNTYKDIEKNGFEITKKIELLLSSDSEVGISKSMGLGLISFSECFQDLAPNIIVLLGDRFEIFSCAAAAMIAKIPIAHIHGGESTEGLIDEPIRHAITKMSHIHFAATEKYRNRIIQLGEQPERVFNFGSPGIDNIYKLNLIESKSNFEREINFKLGQFSVMVTFHPVTLDDNSAQNQFQALLDSLLHFENLKIIFTKPNADTNGRIIIEMIDTFVNLYPDKCCSFISLGQIRYLSALKYVNLVIGNSSSGLTEAPSFKIPTINIGDRQRGRIKASSVIDCDSNKRDIISAINVAVSYEFQQKIKNTKNPYGIAGASEKIVQTMKNISLKEIIKKEFYQL